MNKNGKNEEALVFEEESQVSDSYTGSSEETLVQENTFGEETEENAEDYADVSSDAQTIDAEALTDDEAFEGAIDNSENAINEENTLEQVKGYDYSALDSTDEESDIEADEESYLDAYYAEYGDPEMAMLMKNQETQKMVREVVIGKDDRKRITATTKYPWRAICSLRIKAKDGTNWIGTGFLIGPRTVITAGHVVYMRKHGGWASSIEVIPGRNASKKPYGSCKTSKFHSVKGWTKSNKRSHDYGAIILPKNCKFGNKVGYFGYGNYSLFSLLGLKVNMAGYPGDKPAGTLWWHARKIKFVTPRTLIYNIDSAGGQSGAPVWRIKNGKRYAVGIHTNGSSLGNSATRITKPVFKNLKKWKNMYK